MHTLYGVCEKLSQGCSVILKQISFKYRVDYDAEAGGKVLLNETTEETVVLMGKTVTRSKSHVNLGLDIEDYYRIKDSEKDSTLHISRF